MKDLPEDTIFRSGMLDSVLTGRLSEADRKVRDFDEELFTPTEAAGLIARHIAAYELDPPSIREDDIHMKRKQEMFDGRLDPYRPELHNRERPIWVDGVRISVHVPVHGTISMLTLQPNDHYKPLPPGTLVHDEIIVTYLAQRADDPTVLRRWVEHCEQIKFCVENVGRQIEAYNKELKNRVESAVYKRMKALGELNQQVKSWNIPIRRRGNPPQTFKVPEQRTNVNLVEKPRVGGTSNPVLDDDIYEHILDTCGNMALVMELSPSAFEKISEEDLRVHFLVQLNAQFEGGATAETFNLGGKTDIRIHWEGQVIFIGECKYWHGPEKYTETIDQLLDYVTWRNTKTSILVFNTNRGFTKVVEAIDTATQAHGNFVMKVDDYENESGHRYIMRNKNDDDREFVMTVLAFDVPFDGASRTTKPKAVATASKPTVSTSVRIAKAKKMAE